MIELILKGLKHADCIFAVLCLQLFIKVLLLPKFTSCFTSITTAPNTACQRCERES